MLNALWTERTKCQSDEADNVLNVHEDDAHKRALHRIVRGRDLMNTLTYRGKDGTNRATICRKQGEKRRWNERATRIPFLYICPTNGNGNRGVEAIKGKDEPQVESW